ncbi:regulator of chromosome condensation 1/beta-lactamase-inhibitor protein II, partial [Baffinella frigidus]
MLTTKSQKFRFLRSMLDSVQVDTATHFARIAVGNGHCLGVDHKGQIFMWGDSESAILDKQAGVAAANPAELQRMIKVDFRRRIQTQTEGLTDIMMVKRVTRALEEDKEYLLDHQDEYLDRRRATPALVKALHSIQIFDVACGWTHCAALSCDGQIFTWGAGSFGKLGHGGVWDEPAPRLVQHISKRRPIQIGCGAQHTLCITDNGALWTWGDGRCGENFTAAIL